MPADEISLNSNLTLASSKIQINTWKIAALLIAVLFSIPVITILYNLFVPNTELWRHLADTILGDYIVNSLILMVGVGGITILLGVSTAWLVTMCQFPGSRLFSFLLLLPMAMPAYIIAYTYTGILDVSGPLQNWIRDSFGLSYGEYWFPEIRSISGAILVMSLVLYPYIYLLSRAAFIEQSICVLDVARSLGCSAYRMFFTVALPLVRPAVMVGLSLVLMETLADYGTVQYFGVPTFTTGIFRTWFGMDNSAGAAQLSAMLLGFIVLLIYLEQYSRRRSRYYHSSSRYQIITPFKLRRTQAFSAVVYCTMIILLGFVLPVWFLFKWSLLSYRDTVDEEFIRLLWHSLYLAGITATLAIILSLIIAYTKRRFSGRMMSFVMRTLSLGYAIPGTIIAVGVMLPFAWLDNKISEWLNHLLGLDTGLLLSGSIFVVVFGYLVRFLAISLNTIDASLNKVKASLDEAAMSMGAGSIRIIKQIHLPMIRGSLLTAFLLVFVDVLKELPATLILRPFNFNTLAVKTYELANEERLIDAAVPAIAIVLVGIIPVILLSRSINNSRPGQNA